MNDAKSRQQLQLAFDSANAIVNLAGLPFSETSRVLQERVINGEISFDEAVQEALDLNRARQQLATKSANE